jgi:putative flippase GtrA
VDARTRASGGVISQIVRYGVVAGSGYLLAVVSYAIELDVGVSPYVALGGAFSLNGLFNFALLRALVFPPSGRSLSSDLRRFCIVAGVSFGVNYASFAILYSAVELPAASAQRLAILIAAPVTFLANRLWSFGSSAGHRSSTRYSMGYARIKSTHGLWRR